MEQPKPCFWCNPDAMPRPEGEGPHSIHCPRFREWQRGGFLTEAEYLEAQAFAAKMFTPPKPQ